MPTDAPKTLIVWDDVSLLEQVTTASKIEGVARSEWVREACRRRLAAEDRAAELPGLEVPPHIGQRVTSARVRVPFEDTP